MKKRILMFIAAAICSVTAVSAQMTSDDSAITARVGFASDLGVPISLTYEKGIWDISNAACVTIGGTVAYAKESEAVYSVSDFIIGARGTFHYGIKKWDLFGGVTLGYDIVSVNWDDNSYKDLYDASDSEFFLGLNIGVNYYITDNWAVGAEFGYGLANLNVGVTYKF
ncbi:MAG: hypothetical protein SNG02_06125 [Rikenellaceae bacterium]